MYFFIGLIVIVAVVLIYFIKVYNTLISMNERVNVSWSQVDVILKQRADLIPNLVETVKAAGNYEKDTLENVINARNRFIAAPNQEEAMKANTEISQTLGRLFSLTEAYPELKANTSYIDLQNQISALENKIAKYRQFFNDSVYAYNRYRQAFPKSVIANLFHFNSAEYLEISEEEKATPRIKF